MVVVNQKNSKQSLDISEVRDIFLKKRTHFSGGMKTTPINAPNNSDLRNAFRKKVLDMTSDKKKKYWEDKKIKEGVMKPVSLSNALRAVFELKGAIGYLYRKDYKPGVVKIVLTIPSEQ